MTETNESKQKKSYPLRMDDDVKQWIQQRADHNDRSVNAELNRVLKRVKDAEKIGGNADAESKHPS